MPDSWWPNTISRASRADWLRARSCSRLLAALVRWPSQAVAPGDARVVERVETRQAVACAEDCQAALEARAAGLGDVHEVQHRVAAARGERQPARERWRCAQRQ